MIDPAVFRAMVANGATPEMLLAVVEAAAAVEEEKRAKKRAGNAARQQRFRERHAGEGSGDNNASNALQGVTERDSVTAPPSPSPLPSPCTPNQPPAPTHPDNIPRARTRAGQRMPEGWEPLPLTGDTAKAVDAWPPGAVDRELARFRDWAASATGPNAKKSDWQAAWRNWVRKVDDDGRYRNGSRTLDPQRMAGNRGGARSGFGSTVDAGFDFIADGGPH